jgi:2-(1,2-epoxy-1,2-dihydrophenyl)acetyl-CoA isomerase
MLSLRKESQCLEVVMDYQNIIAEEKNGVGYLTFNRPKALNSFNVDMHREVAEV